MKVKIGNYKGWFGPFQLAELICFWVPKTKDEYGIPEKPDWVHNFGEWIAYGCLEPKQEVGETRPFLGDDREKTRIYKFLEWVDKKKSRKVKVQIDRWDVWNCDSTLGYIIRPMLQKLKVEKNGSPYVDPQDVPEHLRPKNEYPSPENDHLDDTHHERWEWVLDQMIFAFETLEGGNNEDWDRQFHGESNMMMTKLKNGNYQLNSEDALDSFDIDGYKEYQKDIQRGFELFGKYFTALWT